MRADLSALPLLAVSAAPRNACFSDRTSSVTIFILPPRNIPLEICHQSIQVYEPIGLLALSNVTVICLAGLIVIAAHVLLIECCQSLQHRQ